jgi:hypothetical protein
MANRVGEFNSQQTCHAGQSADGHVALSDLAPSGLPL